MEFKATLTGRARRRRPWWAPWLNQEELEVRLVYLDLTDHSWFTRPAIQMYFPWIELPE